MPTNKKILRHLPAVDKLLQLPALQDLKQQLGHAVVKRHITAKLNELRGQLEQGDPTATAWVSSPSFLTELGSAIITAAERAAVSPLRSVFNLTGTVIHTNLGRASLPQAALAAMQRAAMQPLNLEYDLATGTRGDRDQHLQQLITELTGAEAATIVNNNAAAVLLIANTLAAGKEVIISRGELVEIGGAFRIPEVIRSAHCQLREVGTTNRTHRRDYATAITPATGLLMKVHTSNYEIRGFTKSVSAAELVALARAQKIPVASDLGSGVLIDLTRFGLPPEPTVAEVLKAGVDLVCFSGDKLLGGPQAGIIAGRAELIAQLKRNPLKRALRVDKLTLAALAATLNLYRNPAALPRQLPILRDLTRPADEIKAQASRLLPLVDAALNGSAKAPAESPRSQIAQTQHSKKQTKASAESHQSQMAQTLHSKKQTKASAESSQRPTARAQSGTKRVQVQIKPCQSQIGSGALPLKVLPSWALVITPNAEPGNSAQALTQLTQTFRQLAQPVLGRIQSGSLVFDLRGLSEEESFIEQLSQLTKLA